MRRFYFLLILLLLCTLTPAAAQNADGYPLPETLQVITPDNAGHLGQWASLGGDLPGDLAWSADGLTLAVGTTGGVRAYNAINWDMPPKQLPGWKDVRFKDNVNVISGGKIIDTLSGKVISETLDLTPSGKSKIEYRDFDGHAGVLLTDMASGMPTIFDTGLNGTINALVFSSDEQLAAIKMTVQVERKDQSPIFQLVVQLWNVTTGTLVKTLDTTGFDSSDSTGNFGFHNQGKLLVLSTYYNGEDGSSYAIQIWDVRSGKALNPEANLAYLPLVISPDDRLMAFPGAGGISLWSDHKIGVLEIKDSYGNVPVFSPDGELLASYGSTGIQVWKVDTALKLGQPNKVLPISDQIIDEVIFSPDNKLLAASEYDSKVRVWNLETGAVEVVLENVSGTPQFSPNSQWILAQRADNSKFALWDTHTGERLMDFEEKFAINADWTFAAQWYNVTNVRILALPSGEPTRLLQVLDNYLGNIGRFDAVSGHVLFGGQAFNTPTGDVLFKTYVDSPLPDFAFSSDWRRMLLVEDRASFNRSRQPLAYVQEPITEAVNPPWFAGDFVTPETKVFLTPDGKMLGYIRQPQTYPQITRLEFRDVETGAHIAEWMLSGDVQAMTISHDGKWLVLGTSEDYDGNLIFLDLAGDLSTESPIIRPINYANIGGSLNVSGLTFSGDDRRIAVDGYLPFCGDGCIYDYFVKSWDVGLLMSESDLGEQFSLSIRDVHAPIFSQDGKLLLVTSASGYDNVLIPGSVQLWDTVANKKVAELSGDDGLATFSPDGRLLAVHQTDSTVLYDTAELKRGIIKALVTCPDRDKPVNQVAFSPDGKILYVVSENRVRLYGVGS